MDAKAGLQNSIIQAAEMKFLQKLKGCTRLDEFRNEYISRDLQIFSLNNNILEYKHHWFEHVQRMENSKGRRSQGLTLKNGPTFEIGTGISAYTLK
jgi:hypothetical protein